jgi:hypothetical protein
MGLGKKGRVKGNEREWIILEYTAFVQEEGITQCTESSLIMGSRAKRVRKSNRAVRIIKVQYSHR